MNKKKIILIISSLILVIIIIFLFQSVTKNRELEVVDEVFVPEFLTEERKAYYGLKPETKAQVFYDSEGYEIYKIIYDDSDIVLDPSLTPTFE